MARRGDADEWVAVLLPRYAAPRRRHAKARAEAYDVTRHEALREGVRGPELRITDVDADVLFAWEQSWRGTHPSGASGWEWRAPLENVPRRAAVLPFAIWHGGDLCGLALGQPSRRRWNGSRHTITLTFVERRPEPPDVPLRGQVIALALAVAQHYGITHGARHLRLRAPHRNLPHHYQRLGFQAVWKGSVPVHCEREI